MNIALGASLLALSFFAFFLSPAYAGASTLITDTSIISHTVWTKAGSPYIVDGDLYVVLISSLTIKPDVVVKFTPGSSIVFGENVVLDVQGTKEEPVYFTSLKDDSGGDTNGDGSATSPAPGDWSFAALILNRGNVHVSHLKLRYGGAPDNPSVTDPISASLLLVSALNHTQRSIETIEVSKSATVGVRAQTVFGGTLTISNSSFFDNAGYALERDRIPNQFGNFDLAGILDARNNWWGDSSGPFHQTLNPDGLGDDIAPLADPTSQPINFDPWLSENPMPDPAPGAPDCVSDCFSNVLFLPGIEASRLYIPDAFALDGNDRLWEPTSDADARALFMNENGASIRNDIYTKDVIGEAYGAFNVYKSFLADLEAWKNTDHIIADYSAVPYDWRLTLDEILEYGNQTSDGNIHYSGTDRATSTPYIIQELKKLSASSRNNGKVTIIAHSNGGLVAKALLKRLQDTNDPLLERIDVVIFVAVPQTGTANALGAVLHGYDQGIPKNWAPLFLSPQVAREFSYNDPMAHHLLPSAAYFNGEGAAIQTPLATFNDGAATQMFINRYGAMIDNSTELKDFLLGREGRPLAIAGNLNEPAVLRAGLLSYGETVHQSLDAWTPPSHITVHEIAGWGEDTMAGIIYDNDRKCVARTAWICTQYKDTLRYKPDLIVDGDGTVVAPSSLAMSTSTEQVKRWWVNLEQFNADHRPTIVIPNVNHASILEVSELRSFIEHIVVATSSTISLPDYIRDAIPPTRKQNRLRFFLHSPLMLSATDAIGNEISAATSTIPDARYKLFGEVQYISVPASSTPTLHLDGYAEGSFTLEVQEVQGDVVTATTTFLGIPNATTTTAQMSFSDGTIANAEPLMVDIDADGDTDITLQSKIGEIVVPDIIPPEIMMTFATSTNTLAFIGIDDMGTTTISATTTYPVLKKKQKEAKGIATTTVTVRDEADNTTVLVYTEKLPSPDKRDTISIREIVYNGATTTLSGTSLSYKWRTNKNGSYKLFASHIKTNATSTESHYRPKRDLTVIMTKPRDLDDEDSEEDDNVDSRPVKQKLPGMIIPLLVTEKGKVLIRY